RAMFAETARIKRRPRQRRQAAFTHRLGDNSAGDARVQADASGLEIRFLDVKTYSVREGDEINAEVVDMLALSHFARCAEIGVSPWNLLFHHRRGDSHALRAFIGGGDGPGCIAWNLDIAGNHNEAAIDAKCGAQGIQAILRGDFFEGR